MGVFMFFCDFKDKHDRESQRKKTEKLLIFGPERQRTAAELKVPRRCLNLGCDPRTEPGL